MPTLSMHFDAMEPSGWRRVFAPGGYQFWRFDAEDPHQKIRISATWFDGHYLSPKYRGAYQKFLRDPTKRPPPLPRDYPGVAWSVELRGSSFSVSSQTLPAGAFHGGADEIRIGANTIRWEQDVVRIRMESSVLIELTFTFFPDGQDQVTGRIRLSDGEEIGFKGAGSRKREFGVITL